MIKVGDKVKGFKFRGGGGRNSANINYNEQMNRYVGVEGVVTLVGADTFSILYHDDHWSYPLQEYLAIIREEKIKELGIL